MRKLGVYACLFIATVTSAFAGVTVSSPVSGSTVGSPVSFTATATSATCSRGVASMGIYINDKRVYVVNDDTLNTKVSLGAGVYKTVVQEWDYCGGSTFTQVPIKVGGKMLPNLQASGGWRGWGELAPAYEICSSCSPKVNWAMSQSGGATKFHLGGTVPYSDALFSLPVIGQGSTQGLPDWEETLVPATKNFTYDTYFFSSTTEASQVLEFDISQYFQGLSFIWGHQCRIAGGHEWDIWNNLSHKWVHTGISCKPVNNAWNHLVIQMRRTNDNHLLYQSITLNGVTHVLNRYDSPDSVPSGWHGITVKFQLDGNYKQTAYDVYLDKLHLTYW